MPSRFAGLFLAAGLLVCSPALQAQQQKKGAAAPPAVVDPANRPTYKLGPGDVLEIRVWKEPEISVPEVIIRTDSRISLPLVKEVIVGGLTIEELEKHLVAKYRPLVKDPDITVVLRQSHSQRAYVMGAVRKEGPVKLNDRMTVLQVLAESGGVTEYAKRKKIFVLRGSGDKQVRIPFDYEAVLAAASRSRTL